MESSSLVISSISISNESIAAEKKSDVRKVSVDDAVRSAIGISDDEAVKVDVGIADQSKSLTLTAQEIVKKINEKLGINLPGGVESLSPEEVTPEATANRIMAGIAMMFEPFKKSNKELVPSELIDRFMTAARSGVNEGYADAISILEGLGAFKFDGVKSGVESTKKLLDEKLSAFELQKKKELGLIPDQESEEPKAPESAKVEAD